MRAFDNCMEEYKAYLEHHASCEEEMTEAINQVQRAKKIFNRLSHEMQQQLIEHIINWGRDDYVLFDGIINFLAQIVKPQLKIILHVPVEITWYPEDFEGSNITWERFVRKMKDKRYRENTLYENLTTDLSSDAADCVDHAIREGRYRVSVMEEEV